MSVKSWTTQGTPVLLEESHDLPIVDFVIAFRAGAAADPIGKEGLSRMTAGLLRRGTKRLPANEVDEQLARLGARLSTTVGRETTRVHAEVLARNLEPLVALVATLLREPAFRPKDLAQLKRMVAADLVAMRDDDHSLAAHHLRASAFGDHPYGRPIAGSQTSLRRLQGSAVRELWRRELQAAPRVFGAAGAVGRDELAALLRKHFRKPPRAGHETPMPPTRLAEGRRVRIVHKPGRTQSQIAIAGLGAKVLDRELVPLIVADTAFGGMFSSVLSREVRSKRGWSYSVYSSLGFASQRDLWQLWSHPSTSNDVDCLKLELELVERLVDEGVAALDLVRAKKYLVASRCFDVDTASRRLELALDAWLHRLPARHHADFPKKVRAVTRSAAHRAVKQRLSADDLQIVIVGDARRLEREVAKVDRVRDVEVVPFDASL